MKTALKFAMLLLFGLVSGWLSSDAQTDITACQTITAAGVYDLTADLYAPGTCLIKNVSSGTVTINLQGHSIVYVQSSTIHSVTAAAIVHGTGNSLDALPNVSNQTPLPPAAQTLVNVTRISNTSGGASNYTYANGGGTADANCSFGQGFCQSDGIQWVSSPPANGATYYVDYSYNVPGFAIDDETPDLSTLIVNGPGKIIEGPGGYGWDVGVYFYPTDETNAYSTPPTVQNVDFRLWGRSSMAVSPWYPISSINMIGNTAGTTTQNQYGRGYFAGALLFVNAQTYSSTSTTVGTVSGNIIDSDEQNGWMSNVSYQTITGNTFRGTANATNDYQLELYGEYNTVSNNVVVTRDPHASGRGIEMADSYSTNSSNLVDVQDLANNIEYAGCELDGATAGKVLDATFVQGGSLQSMTFKNNIFHAHANAQGTTCPAQALEYDQGQTPFPYKPATIPVDQGNTIIASCDVACTWNYIVQAIPASGATCVHMNAYSYAVSNGDTFDCENVAFFTDNNGGYDNLFENCTINNTSPGIGHGTPFTFWVDWATNGYNSSATFKDCTYNGFNPTTSYLMETDASTTESYLLENTYTVAVRDTTHGTAVSGATVTLTDEHGGTYPGTTDARGNVSIVAPWFLNSMAANSVQTLTSYTDSTHPYNVSIVKTGCTTLNYTEAIMTANVQDSRALAGC